jgi:signal transduction histidine kinase
VTARSSHRLHAARVAAIATVIVMVGYIVAVVVLNVFVVQRLTNQADLRLTERLADAQREIGAASNSGTPTVHRDHDVDDAPSFVWLVSPAGTITSLSSGAPSLPPHHWSTGAITLGAGGTSFRFQAAQSPKGWLVAGTSLGQIQRVQNTLLLFEGILGVVVLVVVFGGALIVGMRASAPLELVRRRQTEFTADASHELRTPLSVIEAEVDLALSRSRDVDAYRAVLERVAGEGRRLRSIVEDLLWLARIDHDRPLPAGGDEVDVVGAVIGGVDRFQALATARGVTLGFRQEGNEPAVIPADPAWIDRLIGVLIDNACRYAGEGGVVEVGVRTSGSRIVLDVDDSGPGIPPEDRELVFDRFHRGVDTPEGTGLGLAIADSVVRATQGAWSIGTSPLGGARMQVSWRKQGHREARRRPRWLLGTRMTAERAGQAARGKPAAQGKRAPEKKPAPEDVPIGPDRHS